MSIYNQSAFLSSFKEPSSTIEKIGHNLNLPAIVSCLKQRVDNMPYHTAAYTQMSSEDMLYSPAPQNPQRDYIEANSISKATFLSHTVLCTPALSIAGLYYGSKALIKGIGEAIKTGYNKVKSFVSRLNDENQQPLLAR